MLNDLIYDINGSEDSDLDAIKPPANVKFQPSSATIDSSVYQPRRPGASKVAAAPSINTNFTELRNLKSISGNSMRLHNDAEVMAKIKDLVKAHDSLKSQNKKLEKSQAES